MNVEDAKKRGPERHLSKNYNFLGPGTFYAARMKGSDFYENLMKEAGRKVVGTKPYNKPYNALDACAKVHDKTYNNPNATAAQVLASDKAVQACAKRVGPGLDLSASVLAKVTRAGFEGKNALEKVGVLRKGSFADGGDKDSAIGRKLKGAVGLGKKAGKAIKRGINTI